MRVRLVLLALLVLAVVLTTGCRVYYDPYRNVWLYVDDDPESPDFGWWVWEGPGIMMAGEGRWMSMGTASYLIHYGPIWIDYGQGNGLIGANENGNGESVLGFARFFFDDSPHGQQPARGYVYLFGGAGLGPLPPAVQQGTGPGPKVYWFYGYPEEEND